MAERKTPAGAAAGIPAEIAKLSFEEALEALEEIVRQLETGEGSLENAIGAYERGAHLKRHCELKLKEAKARVEKISMTSSGTITATPEEGG